MIRDRDPIDVYNNYLVPTVIEQTARGERAFDIYYLFSNTNTCSTADALPSTMPHPGKSFNKTFSKGPSAN